MEKALIEFAGRLRAGGVAVSPAELLDACAAATHIGLSDRETVKAGLRTAMVKRGRDIPVFDALFDLFFSGGPVLGSPPEDDEAESPRDMSGALSELIDMFQPDLSFVSEQIMTGQFAALTRMMLARSQGLGMDRMESPLQVGFFQRRFRQEMDLDRVRDDSIRFLDEMEERGLDAEDIRAMREYVRDNLDRVEDELRNLIQRELARNRYQFIRRMEEEELSERPVARMSEADILAMRSAVEGLARRLKERLSLRWRKTEAGRLDLKATLRKNIGLGGPLPDLRFRNKKPARPQVAALCDVSNSVRNFSRFMLLFLYTLKEVTARVRSFIFVGDLAEVTDLFGRRELNEAVNLASAAHGLSYVFRTDYGSALSQFAAEHLTGVNSKTTVFILGDARNNYFEPHAEALEAISRRAKRVIWLNPEPRPNWRIGDSIMRLYEPYCTRVAECGNLNQLSTIIEENLVP